ncbi:MAG: NmrA/HSCARG family protein [Salinisphaera sp.]|jgi:uncharacterized protein YbjT (DUF2867 family)|nr:NmrA/HSCARG family protein [Salinisphaera sp.]
MSILITGSTGTIGSAVVKELVSRKADVKALMRDTSKADRVPGATAVAADLLDPESIRAALDGVDTVFVLNAVVPDELTQALFALNLAREAGIQRFVYFSVLNADRFVDVPHFAAKDAVERMIEVTDLPATILRPSYFMQNDAGLKTPLTEYATYPMPVGSKGVAMVDIRDIAEVAAIKLIERHEASGPLPRETIEIAGPEPLTGDGVARIWSDVLGRTVAYGGDDLDAFEAQMRQHAPGWSAYDIRCMLARFQTNGMTAAEGSDRRLTEILGHAPRSYQGFAKDTAAGW